MKQEKLEAMANQIATFFRSYPDDEAAAGIRRHLTSFWTPQMRSDLERRLQQDVSTMDPLVVRAMHSRDTVASPVERVTSPAQEAGQLASDAG